MEKRAKREKKVVRSILTILSPELERRNIEASVEEAEKKVISSIVQQFRNKLKKLKKRVESTGSISELSAECERVIVQLLTSPDTKLSEPELVSVIVTEAGANNKSFFQILGLALSDPGKYPRFSRLCLLLLSDWTDRLRIVERKGKLGVSFRGSNAPKFSYRNSNLGLAYFTDIALVQYIGIKSGKTKSTELKQFVDRNMDSVRAQVKRLGLLRARRKLIREVRWSRGRLVCLPVESNSDD